MKPTVRISENSGFCFGVKRATDRLAEKLASAKSGERIVTLGNLIHNEAYIAELKEKGVEVVRPEEIDALAA